jgi:PIN domain nuclease of toxin-antitoxin system
MSAPVLDTHAWVWWLSRDPRLGAPTLDALDALPAGSRPRVADISLWGSPCSSIAAGSL